jgi:RNA polymerase sigma factor (sigma-70 family)
MDTPGPQTSLALIRRLQGPADAGSWDQFVRRYGPGIYHWCAARGLQPADAEDVTQTVLLRLVRYIQAYDPARGPFRAWLRGVVGNAVSDFHRARRAAPAGSGDTAVLALLDTAEARADLARALEEQFDLELLDVACERVRARVEARVWDCFLLREVEGWPAAEVAARLGLPVANVFVYQGRVRKLLRAEVARLEESTAT